MTLVSRRSGDFNVKQTAVARLLMGVIKDMFGRP
jgi:hypothetical protein